jgi:RNA polymerase sigma factor (TIGR02999 family)
MSAGDVSRLLQALDRGELNAATDLLPLAALVHEAYLRLVRNEAGQHFRRWEGRRHFFAAASEAMRRILVESARRRLAAKRGGDMKRQDFDAAGLATAEPDDELLAIHEELDALQAVDAQAAEVVRLRYFVGMTTSEVAEVLDVSKRTVEYAWSYARAWLRERIQRQ